MFFCSHEREAQEEFFNMLLQKIVCVDKKEALLWPQVWPGSAVTHDLTPVRRRILMEVIQFLLVAEESGIVLESIACLSNEKSATGYAKSGFSRLPAEIHLIIQDYLDDFSAICLAMTSRRIFNILLGRIQDIVCPLSELGCWAGKPMVRAGVVLDMNDAAPIAGDEEAGKYWAPVIEAKMMGVRERGYHTLYDSDNPQRLDILHSIAKDLRTPKTVRRYLSAVLTNTEYENMFRAGEKYVIRNLDKMEYVEFPTGKLGRVTTRPEGVLDDTLIQALHPGEALLEAITWLPAEASSTKDLVKGAWAGDRIDLVTARKLGDDDWRKLRTL
ncbi:hypothetical protein TWF694_001529 [Orbilia ellipsospora]|uniref:F-box domain-containing protein n=1 Tax=Orbilia ellipsospora TaxID=2528407 RepID=A0AAV9XYE6_9PEZI